MGKMDEVKQNIEGKTDEFVGEVKETVGSKGGTTKKIKGKLKQATAPLQNVKDDEVDDYEDDEF